MRRIPSILNLGPWNKQDQGIPRCSFRGGSHKEYGSAGVYNNVGPHGNAVPHGRNEEVQRKERIIYDTTEVLPPPSNELMSESKSESDSENDESQSESGDSDGDGN